MAQRAQRPEEQAAQLVPPEQHALAAVHLQAGVPQQTPTAPAQAWPQLRPQVLKLSQLAAKRMRVLMRVRVLVLVPLLP